ncbi:hypothetical protein KOW79_010085 [Hemibagrus wyckioides]|uniref:Uncharacterized protein n=1 Tax=Hemibagrus wyckioides TaxID=337641 RepID=A0A9D3NR42_9TELE|nr:hypothetical protein KOW79_010085 [Hemibagrus wyckioides]
MSSKRHLSNCYLCYVRGHLKTLRSHLEENAISWSKVLTVLFYFFNSHSWVVSLIDMKKLYHFDSWPFFECSTVMPLPQKSLKCSIYSSVRHGSAHALDLSIFQYSLPPRFYVVSSYS